MIKALLKRICHIWLLCAFFLYTSPAFAEAVKHVCQKKESVCVDGPSTKTIDGVPITKDCWEYQDTYECLVPDSADYCAPLKKPAAECTVEGQSCLEKASNGECLKYTHQYSCDVDIKTLNGNKLPPKVTELEPTHLITSEWEDVGKCGDGKCKPISEKCLEGPATKIINGVAVTKDCWRKQTETLCSTGDDKDQCKAFDNNKSCKLIDNKCSFTLPDGSCQIREKTYSCVTEVESEEPMTACVDRDFTNAMTKLEMAREMGRYYDPKNQRFFNGEANKCSIKLGGALDGWMGGDCCKADGDPQDMVDWVVQAGTQMAVQNALTSVASHYTYTLLTQQVSAGIANSLAWAGSVSAVTGGGSSLGAFGVSASVVNGNLVVAFNPVAFAFAIAMMALQAWLSCEQPEVLTAMKREANLCHYVGSYCGSKFLGACVKKVESQCCYVSKLAKIINVGGKEQLQMTWGTPESPSCEGFTAQDLEKLDFSKLDLEEFYQDIYAKMENLTKQSNTTIDKSKGKIAGGNNYYDK